MSKQTDTLKWVVLSEETIDNRRTVTSAMNVGKDMLVKNTEYTYNNIHYMSNASMYNHTPSMLFPPVVNMSTVKKHNVVMDKDNKPQVIKTNKKG